MYKVEYIMIKKNYIHFFRRYVGEMGRDCATRKLEQRINGTYLLRVRPQGPTHPDETPYALSLK